MMSMPYSKIQYNGNCPVLQYFAQSAIIKLLTDFTLNHHKSFKSIIFEGTLLKWLKTGATIAQTLI